MFMLIVASWSLKSIYNNSKFLKPYFDLNENFTYNIKHCGVENVCFMFIFLVCGSINFAKTWNLFSSVYIINSNTLSKAIGQYQL